MKEKEVEKMIECLKETNNPIVWVDLDLERSYDANNLNLERMNIETCIEQLENADQPALVCGSLFLAGKVLSNLTK
jgi:folylpolyglutamate synthase/dihydropteroate synthase